MDMANELVFRPRPEPGLVNGRRLPSVRDKKRRRAISPSVHFIVAFSRSVGFGLVYLLHHPGGVERGFGGQSHLKVSVRTGKRKGGSDMDLMIHTYINKYYAY